MNNKKILIRKANQSDCRDVLKWRNDEISQKMSFNPKIITSKMHKVWFFEVLNNNNKVMYIGELGDYKVGVCRFDFDKSRLVSEVSINMNPHLRGKGFGKLFLKSSILKYIKNNKNNIVAKVRSNNLASIKIFTHSGFEIIQDKDNRIYFEKEFKK